MKRILVALCALFLCAAFTPQPTGVAPITIDGNNNVGINIGTGLAKTGTAITIGTAANNTALCNVSGGSAIPVPCNGTQLSTLISVSGINLGTATSAANPQISGDATSGLYTSGADKIDFSIANTKTVEIGTSALAVTGAISATTTGIFNTFLGVGTTSINAGMNIDASKGVLSIGVPSGTTGQRPGTPVNGEIRYNSTLNTLEGYINATWQQITTGGKWGINVTAWPYNAACDGTTNDTSIFNTASAAGLPVFVPPTTGGCALNAFNPPTNTVIFGTSGPQYDFNPSAAWSHVVPASGATAIWNYDGRENITVINLDTLGSAALSTTSNVVCINAGSSAQMQFHDSSYRFCGNGGYGDGGDYPNSVRSYNTNWIDNGQLNNSAALNNLVDSQVCGGSFTGNFQALYFGPGANNNTICHETRIEFNENVGVACNGATKLSINGDFDSNAAGAIGFANCGRSTGKTGVGQFYDTGSETGIRVDGRYTRNGSLGTSGNQAQFEFYGGNSNIVFGDIDTSHETNDDESGGNRPKYIAEYADSTDSGIHFTGGNLTGWTTSFDHFITGTGPSDYSVIGATGVSNKMTTLIDATGVLKVNTVSTPGTPTVTNFGTGGAATWTYKIVACADQACVYHTAASAAGSTTTGNATLTSANYNVLTWTKVQGALVYQIYRTAHGTTPSTNGLIGTIAAQQNLQVIADVHTTGGGGLFWDTGLAGDASVAPATNLTGGIAIGTAQVIAGAVNVNDSSGYYINGVAFSGGGGGTLTVGTTPIASGTTTRVLFDNGAVLGEYTISGSGNVCMTTNCSMTTPALGTPSALVLTNATGTPSAINLTNGTALPVGSITGLGTGMATFLATPSSANLRGTITDESGTGALIFAGGALGAATATTINGVTIPSTTDTTALLGTNQSFTKGQAVTPTAAGTQSAAGTLTPDFSTSNSVTFTFGAGNLTIANATNVKAGQTYIISATQDSVGSRTITWGTNYKCGGSACGSGGITLSTAANAKDIISCWADTTTTINCTVAVKAAQ